MVKTYEEFLKEELPLNEENMKVINEAAEKIAEELKNNGDIDEGLLGGIVGGLTGVTIGPAIGQAICKALGITNGLLYNLLNSRVFTTAVASYIGYKS